MKTLACLTASLLAGATLLPLPAFAEPAQTEAAPATEASPEAAVETTEEIIVTDEVVTRDSSEEAPDQTIDVSNFQEPDSTLPDEPADVDDAGLLQGEDWPAPTEAEMGPPKKGSADHLRQVARIRHIRTIAQREPSIRREKFRAEAARTPEGRRTLLRNYYLLVHNRMVQLDPSLKDLLEADLLVKLNRLEQRRIRPSVLIEPYQPLPGSRATERTVVVVETQTTTETTTTAAQPQSE